MADQAGTLEWFALQLGVALQPLEQHLATDNAIDFLRTLGVALPAPIAGDSQLRSALAAGAGAAAGLGPAIADLDAAITADDASRIISAGAALVAKIGTLTAAFEQISSSLSVAATSGSLSAPQVAALQALAGQIARRIFDYVLIEYLRTQANAVWSTLTLIGVLDHTTVPGDPTDPLQPPFRLEELRLERLGNMLSKPSDFLRDAFGFGDASFDGLTLLSKVKEIFDGGLEGVGLPMSLLAPTGGPAVLEAYLFRLSVDPAASPPSMTFRLRTPATRDFTQTFPLGGVWQAVLTAKARFDSGLDGTVSPPFAVALQPPSGAVSIDVEAGFTAERSGGTVVLVSETAGAKLEATKVAFTVGFVASLSTTGGAAGEPAVNAAISGGKLSIDTSHSDGFLSKLLSGANVQATFDLAAGWQPSTGLRFHGSAGIEFETSLAIALGPVDLNRLHIGIGLDSSGGITFELSLGLAATIGPLAVAVERVGATGKLTFPSQGGNLGRADFTLGFKPPTGLGITIDAGPVTGGGFIEFDPVNGRYAGVLALSLYSIQVKAIGLLDTKLPGGESGYSFLIIISVEFTPIQLGFGFTLNGVGGLAGINRNFVVDAIQAGLRQHSLDHILFPKDPVKNAPAIISDLRTIFPPAQGRYVFGPMLELGWGGGANLVTAELGVLLALPAPVVIAVLGQLNVTLPSPEAAAVELHLDVLGIIDFGQKTFSLDAVLHDSRIVAFTISGEMAMRLSWGQNPSFALSIGGTNPQWNQLPAGFPTLKRLTISLSESSALRLTIQSYLAITSNTFQFGARAELYIGSGSFNVYGWIGFDALLIFTPFSFVVDFTAGLALRSGTSTLMGISVDGELSGPTPWHAKGDAHISILFFEISVSIDTTWGDAAQVDAPVIDAWSVLHDAIANLGNWSGALPASVPAVATLAAPPRPSTDTAATVLVDPSGVLTLRERVLPLNQTLTKFGEAIPGPQNAFLLEPGHVTLGGVATPFTTVRDKFAPAQFEQLSDQEKLSRPSFEDRDAGFTIGAGQLTCGTAVGLDVVYADKYVDDHAPVDHAPPTFQPTLERQLAWARTNPAANSGLWATAMGKYAPPATAAQLISYAEERFVVATTTDLTGRLDISRPVTKGEAYQALAAHLTNNPHDRGLLQVVPTYELAS